MNEQKPIQNNSEEVDLGQLFKLIGKGFDKIGNAIKALFSKAFHVLILFLMFIQKHFIKFVIAGVVGLAVGYFFDKQGGTMYKSEMIVEPNFGSVQQLYNNVNYYNELAREKDFEGLSNAFKINVDEASNIETIKVSPFIDENQKYRLFDEFIKGLDTTTIKNIKFDNFLKNFNSQTSKFHKITFNGFTSVIAKKCEAQIINAIAENKYFEFQKTISNDNLIFQEEIYKNQLNKIDSLYVFYQNLALKSVEQSVPSTTISLSDGEKDKDVNIELLNKIDEIKEFIVDINIEKANNKEIINVISAFPNQGVAIKGVLETYKFFGFVLAIGILTMILVLLEVNKFLKKYKANLQA